jgi:hypothetical protein
MPALRADSSEKDNSPGSYPRGASILDCDPAFGVCCAADYPLDGLFSLLLC